MTADTVGSRQLLHVGHHRDEVPQACLVEYGSLGLARRARRVNHIRKTVGTGQVDGVECRGIVAHDACHEVIDKEGLGSSGTEFTLCLLSLQHGVRCDENLRLGVLQHIA